MTNEQLEQLNELVKYAAIVKEAAEHVSFMEQGGSGVERTDFTQAALVLFPNMPGGAYVPRGLKPHIERQLCTAFANEFIPAAARYKERAAKILADHYAELKP